MSRFTTQLRWICEVAAGVDHSSDDNFFETLQLFEGKSVLADHVYHCTGYEDVDTIIALARPKIFDFSYPIFDENYRTVLESKILKHFYTEEIAHETVGRWKLALSCKMAEIMPYYNQLYKSELIDFNPLYDTDVTRDHEINREENVDEDTSKNTVNNATEDMSSDTTANGTQENENISKKSDTPQGAITDLADGKYLTEATIVNDENKFSNTGNSTTESENHFTGNETGTRNEDRNTTENYVEHVLGKSGGGSYSKYLQEFRETFLNIDMMVIKELECLFFGLYECSCDSDFSCTFSDWCRLPSNIGYF